MSQSPHNRFFHHLFYFMLCMVINLMHDLLHVHVGSIAWMKISFISFLIRGKYFMFCRSQTCGLEIFCVCVCGKFWAFNHNPIYSLSFTTEAGISPSPSPAKPNRKTHNVTVRGFKCKNPDNLKTETRVNGR